MSMWGTKVGSLPREISALTSESTVQLRYGLSLSNKNIGGMGKKTSLSKHIVFFIFPENRSSVPSTQV